MNEKKPKAPAKDRATELAAVRAQPLDAGRDRPFVLPKNCFVVPMVILDPPEPIKKNRKTKS